MKGLLLLLCVLFSLTVSAGIQVTTDSSGSIGVFNKINCDSTVACTKTKFGTVDLALSGTSINTQVDAATSALVTLDDCGSTVVNSATAVITLPEASTALGCEYTFVTGNASNFDVNPDDADQILVETDAAGDAIRNATLGNSITIEAISASEWAPISNVGTWTDVN